MPISIDGGVSSSSLSLLGSPGENAVSAVWDLLKYMHEHAMSTGESEWVVGEFLNSSGYAEIPLTYDGYSSTDYVYKELSFQVFSDYLVQGQTIFSVSTDYANGFLVWNGTTPRIYYNSNFRAYELYSSSGAFYWSNPDTGITSVQQSNYVRLGYGYNIPKYWYNYNNSGVPGVLVPYNNGVDIFGGSLDFKMVVASNVKSIADGKYSAQIYIPVDPTETYNSQTIYEPIEIFVSEWNESNPSDTINPADIPTWEDLGETDQTEPTDETGGCCGCNCTTIYVNADGTLTISNDISGDYMLNIDNNADINLQLTAAAGAFGAGAIVIDPDANINLAAGAFGAGAFGAGAIVDPNVSVSGSVSVGDISGSVSIGASEITISGGDINIDQSGGSITNNYYYDPSEPVLEFTIDYNEIISEDEFESIITQETYEIPELETWIASESIYFDMDVTESPPVRGRSEFVSEGPWADDGAEYASELSEVSGAMTDSIKLGWNMLEGMGLNGVFLNTAIIAALWKVIKGA